jgi:hypothetical protein
MARRQTKSSNFSPLTFDFVSAVWRLWWPALRCRVAVEEDLRFAEQGRNPFFPKSAESLHFLILPLF